MVCPDLLYRSLVLRASTANGRQPWDSADHHGRSAGFGKPTSREGSRRHNSQAPVGLRERDGNTSGRGLNHDEHSLGCAIEGRRTCRIHLSRLRSLRDRCPVSQPCFVPPSTATRDRMPALARHLSGRGLASPCNAFPAGSGAAKSRDSDDMRRAYLTPVAPAGALVRK
jgi:hypothetical protein